MGKDNITGRTFWDFIAQKRGIVIVIVVILLAISSIYFFNLKINYAGLGIEKNIAKNAKDSLATQEPAGLHKPSELVVPSQKNTMPQPKKIESLTPKNREINEKLNNNSGVIVENNGINNGVMAGTVNSYTVPPVSINILNWDIKNQKVDSIQGHTRLPSNEVPFKYLFYNEARYKLNIPYNIIDMAVIIKRKDIYFPSFNKPGITLGEVVGIAANDFRFIRWAQPQGGIYYLRLYSEKPISDITAILDFITGCGSNLMYICHKNTRYGSTIQKRNRRQHKHNAEHKA